MVKNCVKSASKVTVVQSCAAHQNGCVWQTENWPQYVERLQFYFKANDIDNGDKQVSIFLSVCGPKCYNLLRNLLTPVKPGDKTLAELCKVLEDYYTPAPSEIVERFKFNSRSRKKCENISCFVAELRKLAEHCNYNDHLENMLRDRLVCGINDPRMQRRLLSESGLTFKKALELAQGMETAAKQTEELSHTQYQTAEVKKFHSSHDSTSHSATQKNYKKVSSTGQNSKTKTQRTGTPCIRCGGSHAPHECPHKDVKCYACQKLEILQPGVCQKTRPVLQVPKCLHLCHSLPVNLARVVLTFWNQTPMRKSFRSTPCFTWEGGRIHPYLWKWKCQKHKSQWKWIQEQHSQC